MQIDVARVLGLVTRSVRSFEKDGKLAPTAGLVEASRGHMTSAAVKDDEVLVAMRRC